MGTGIGVTSVPDGEADDPGSKVEPPVVVTGNSVSVDSGAGVGRTEPVPLEGIIAEGPRAVDVSAGMESGVASGVEVGAGTSFVDDMTPLGPNVMADAVIESGLETDKDAESEAEIRLSVLVGTIPFGSVVVTDISIPVDESGAEVLKGIIVEGSPPDTIEESGAVVLAGIILEGKLPVEPPRPVASLDCCCDEGAASVLEDSGADVLAGIIVEGKLPVEPPKPVASLDCCCDEAAAGVLEDGGTVSLPD